MLEFHTKNNDILLYSSTFESMLFYVLKISKGKLFSAGKQLQIQYLRGFEDDEVENYIIGV